MLCSLAQGMKSHCFVKQDIGAVPFNTVFPFESIFAGFFSSVDTGTNHKKRKKERNNEVQ